MQGAGTLALLQAEQGGYQVLQGPGGAFVNGALVQEGVIGAVPQFLPGPCSTASIPSIVISQYLENIAPSIAIAHQTLIIQRTR